MHKCTLCNEDIDETAVEIDEIVEIEGEMWHAECYAEYFDAELEAV